MHALGLLILICFYATLISIIVVLMRLFKVKVNKYIVYLHSAHLVILFFVILMNLINLETDTIEYLFLWLSYYVAAPLGSIYLSIRILKIFYETFDKVFYKK
jgi:hypothetical protein